MSRYGWIRRSLMNCQMIRVISSPSSSTTGFFTLILLMRVAPRFGGWLSSRSQLNWPKITLTSRYFAFGPSASRHLSSVVGGAANVDEELIQLARRGASRRAQREHNSHPVSYTHLRAHETRHDLVCRLLLE